MLHRIFALERIFTDDFLILANIRLQIFLHKQIFTCNYSQRIFATYCCKLFRKAFHKSEASIKIWSFLKIFSQKEIFASIFIRFSCKIDLLRCETSELNPFIRFESNKYSLIFASNRISRRTLLVSCQAMGGASVCSRDRFLYLDRTCICKLQKQSCK